MRKLVNTDRLIVDGDVCIVKYFAVETIRGERRFSAEIVLPSADVVILDEDSLARLESRVRRVIPATLYSRVLAARATAA